jgi:hypothetical protein
MQIILNVDTTMYGTLYGTGIFTYFLLLLFALFHVFLFRHFADAKQNGQRHLVHQFGQLRKLLGIVYSSIGHFTSPKIVPKGGRDRYRILCLFTSLNNTKRWRLYAC